MEADASEGVHYEEGSNWNGSAGTVCGNGDGAQYDYNLYKMWRHYKFGFMWKLKMYQTRCAKPIRSMFKVLLQEYRRY